MGPRVIRQLVLVLCIAITVAALLISANTKDALATRLPNASITKGFCASDSNGTVAYFTKIFDANIKAQTQISTAGLNFAFKNYLIEEYDFKPGSNFPTQCLLFATLSQAQARKDELVALAKQARKEVMEVTWTPGPLSEKPIGDGAEIGPSGPIRTFTICAVGHQITMYFSAVFDTVGSSVNAAWNDGFNNFLSKNYSAQGDASCTTMNTRREAERLLKDRIAGVRSNNRKAVETGWKFDPNDLAGNKQRPRPTPTPDDDPEPVTPSRPPAKAAPADIRQFATQEVPVALALCQNDRLVSGAFDCYCIQRAIYNYRMEHASEPGPPEPLKDLFGKDKINCSSCIAQFVEAWATSHAQSQSLPLPKAQCVSKRFETALRAKPYPSHVKELFNAAIVACR